MKEKIKLNQKVEELFKFLTDKSTSFIFLVASSIFVAFSIVYDRYFFETVLTLIYALGATYLMIARKHESIGPYLVGKNYRLVIYVIVFVVWFFLWAILMWRQLDYLIYI